VFGLQISLTVTIAQLVDLIASNDVVVQRVLQSAALITRAAQLFWHQATRRTILILEHICNVYHNVVGFEAASVPAGGVRDVLELASGKPAAVHQGLEGYRRQKRHLPLVCSVKTPKEMI
jgi:hypothetical protein